MDLASVSDSDNEYDELAVLDLVDDAIVADSHSEKPPLGSLHCLHARRTRLFLELHQAVPDPALDLFG